MFVLLRLYVVFEASCRHSGLMFPWPPPDAVQRSDSFSRVVISACVVSSPTATGVEDGGIMATISEAKCSVIGNRERARPNGERGVLFLAFDPFFFLFFFFFFFGKRSRPCWGGRAVIDRRRGCRGDGWISLFSTLKGWQRSKEVPNPQGDED